VATPLTLPFPPLAFLDRDGPLTEDDVARTLGERLDVGVSVCVRSTSGPEKRGGYYFHVRRTREGHLALSTFDTRDVITLEDMATLVAFMNHASGRQYSEAMWEISQQINLRTDRVAASE
jgi:hypothetical protein